MANIKYAKIIAIATTVCVILLGVAFIVCTLHLYFTGGDQPYSRERVGEYLLVLAIPSALTVSLTAAGLVLRIIHGRELPEKAARSHSEQLESFASWFELSDIEGETKEFIRREKEYRKMFSAVTYTVSALIFVGVLVYFCFFANFSVDNLNSDVILAMAVSLPLSAIAIGIHVPRLYLSEKSCKKELDLMKTYIKANPINRKEMPNEVDKRENYFLIARYLIVGAAIALIILGITNGGMADVLGKAVKICTECIGLG